MSVFGNNLEIPDAVPAFSRATSAKEESAAADEGGDGDGNGGTSARLAFGRDYAAAEGAAAAEDGPTAGRTSNGPAPVEGRGGPARGRGVTARKGAGTIVGGTAAPAILPLTPIVPSGKAKAAAQGAAAAEDGREDVRRTGSRVDRRGGGGIFYHRTTMDTVPSKAERGTTVSCDVRAERFLRR